MAELTPNLNLKKPEYNEYGDVKDLNDNMDIIDGAVKADKDDIQAIKDWQPSGNGTNDQILRTNGDGTTRWDNAATQEEISAAAEAWMNAHIDQGETLAIDNTLTLSGYAADAAKTGEKLSDLNRALNQYMHKYSFTASNEDTTFPFEVLTGQKVNIKITSKTGSGKYSVFTVGHTGTVYTEITSAGDYSFTASYDGAIRIYPIGGSPVIQGTIWIDSRIDALESETATLDADIDSVNMNLINTVNQYMHKWDFNTADDTTFPFEVKTGQKVNIEVTAFSGSGKFSVFTTGHSGTVYAELNAKGKYSFTAAYDGTIRIYPIGTNPSVQGTICIDSRIDDAESRIEALEGLNDLLEQYMHKWDFNTTDDTTFPFEVKAGQKVSVDVTSITGGQFSIFTVGHSGTVYYNLNSKRKYTFTAAYDGQLRIYPIGTSPSIQGSIWIESRIDEIENNEPILTIVPYSSTVFRVFVPCTNSRYLYYEFTRTQTTKTLDGQSVLTMDIWDVSIYNDLNNKVLQGNFNFIHELAAPSGHGGYVGAGDGCAVMKWCKFFADGVIFDPSTATGPVKCKEFRCVEKIAQYLSDGSGGTLYTNTTPVIDGSGNPVVESYNTMDFTITEKGVNCKNRTIIETDGIKYATCFGAMLCGFYPYFDNVIISDNEMTWNKVVEDGDNLTVITQGDSTINLNETRYKIADSAILYGDNMIASCSVRKIITGSKNNINIQTWLPPNNDNRLKIYFMPVVSTTSAENIAEGENVDTFNSGDIIEVEYEKVFRYTNND